jgi:hypothetical protein
VRPGRAEHDATWQAVASNTLGDDLVVKVLSEIVDRRERALLFAHVALDLPLASVARTLRQDRKGVEEIVNRLIGRLRADEELHAAFANVRQAGRPEHYLDLASKLGLQDWFCGHCKRFMLQPAVGRPRITCSDNCRKRLYRSKYAPPRRRRQELTVGSQRPPALEVSAREAEAMRDALRTIIEHIEGGEEGSRIAREATIRSKAIILLGFTCPLQVTPATLAAFTTDDVIETPRGLEILFRWGDQRTKQYVTIPPDQDRSLCPVRWLRTWDDVQRTRGPRGATLFGEAGGWIPLSSQRVTGLIEGAVRDAGLHSDRRLRANDLLPAYLKEIATAPTRTIR